MHEYPRFMEWQRRLDLPYRRRHLFVSLKKDDSCPSRSACMIAVSSRSVYISIVPLPHLVTVRVLFLAANTERNVIHDMSYTRYASWSFWCAWSCLALSSSKLCADSSWWYMQSNRRKRCVIIMDDGNLAFYIHGRGNCCPFKGKRRLWFDCLMSWTKKQ